MQCKYLHFFLHIIIPEVEVRLFLGELVQVESLPGVIPLPHGASKHTDLQATSHYADWPLQWLLDTQCITHPVVGWHMGAIGQSGARVPDVVVPILAVTLPAL